MADKPAFAIAVVGSPNVMSEAELFRLLDLLVNRHTATHQIVLLTPGFPYPGGDWPKARGHATYLVPPSNGPVRQDCELAAWADALVVLGDPTAWSRLIALCEEAGTPVRVYRTRPKLPPPPPPAWDLGGM